MPQRSEAVRAGTAFVAAALWQRWEQLALAFGASTGLFYKVKR